MQQRAVGGRRVIAVLEDFEVVSTAGIQHSGTVSVGIRPDDFLNETKRSLVELNRRVPCLGL